MAGQGITSGWVSVTCQPCRNHRISEDYAFCEQPRFQNHRNLNCKFISLAHKSILISSPRLVWWTWLQVVLGDLVLSIFLFCSSQVTASAHMGVPTLSIMSLGRKKELKMCVPGLLKESSQKLSLDVSASILLARTWLHSPPYWLGKGRM